MHAGFQSSTWKVVSFTASQRCAWRIFQAGKGAWICQDLAMRKNVDTFLNVSNLKNVCSTNFKCWCYFDQTYSFVQWQLCVDLSFIIACVELLLILIRVACIKFSWNFASNIKSCFLNFPSYLEIKLWLTGRPLFHNSWRQKSKEFINYLKRYRRIGDD